MQKALFPDLAPTIGKQRIIALDILRGFAILSILFVHMRLFFQSMLYSVDLLQQASLVDRIADIFVLVFIEGKFFPIFSFLFGLGLAMQWEKAREFGHKTTFLHIRRFLILFIIGTVHALFFWTGDILVLWAVFGFLLLIFFRNAKPKTLLICSAVFLLFFFFYYSLLTGVTEIARITPEGAQSMDMAIEDSIAFFEESRRSADVIFAEGSFMEVTSQRSIDFVSYTLSGGLTSGMIAFGMMILGLYAGKAKLHENIEDKLNLFKKLRFWGLVIGLPANIVYVFIKETAIQNINFMPSLEGMFAYLCFSIGAPLLSIFYMSSIVLLLQSPKWKTRLALFAPVGRMALTNYILQSIISTTLSYGYGFGLYGRVGVALGLVLAVIIAIFQILFSKWWFKRFTLGPLEWLWRSLSYFEFQPIARRLV